MKTGDEGLSSSELMFSIPPAGSSSPCMGGRGGRGGGASMSCGGRGGAVSSGGSGGRGVLREDSVRDGFFILDSFGLKIVA